MLTVVIKQIDRISHPMAHFHFCLFFESARSASPKKCQPIITAQLNYLQTMFSTPLDALMFNWLIQFVCNSASLVKCESKRKREFSIADIVVVAPFVVVVVIAHVQTLEPEEIDEFENDELLLLLSSSISSNACLASSVQAAHWWRSRNELHCRDDIW